VTSDFRALDEPQVILPHAPQRPPLVTRKLLLLCTASFFQMFSFQLLLPVVPLYLLDIGGTESQVGLIFGITAGSALLLRPLTGWIADRYGRKPLFLAGNIGFLISMALYPLARSLVPLLAVRSFQGAGLSATSTAGSTMVADLAPPTRRAEAMGIYGVAINVASALAPLLGATLAIGIGFNAVFLVGGLTAATGIFFSWMLREPSRPQDASPPHFILVSRDALFPAAIALCVFVPIGVVLSYVAVFADREGLGNPGLFFLPYSVTLVFVRLLAGRVSDRYGRVTVLFPALIALIAALVVISTAEHVLVLLLGAVLLGIGFGIAHPTILAMAVDRAPAGRQGASMSTLIGSFDLGIGGGSALAGVLVATAGLRGVFLLACCAPMLGVLLLATSIQRDHYR
jgi:MFS family permease